MPRKKKTSLEPEIEEKLKYIGLSLDKVPKELLEFEPLNYKIPKQYEEKKYKQYRYIPVEKIQILLSPTNRLEDIEEKYSKARPLSDYLDSKNEENILRHTVFLNMLKQVTVNEILEIEKEQAELAKNIPFGIKYPSNYLWQIYYSEETDKYFMIVPTQDSNYSAFFYLLKQKIEKRKNASIFVPINDVEYSKKYFSKTGFEDIENYLWLFTKEWPSIYEIYDIEDNLQIHIIGETNVYETIKSKYHITLNSQIEANHFYKLLKAMFILQTEIPDYFEFTTNIDKNGSLEFYFKNQQIKYSEMAKFIKTQYSIGINTRNEYTQKIEQNKIRLEELKRIASMQDIEYLEKERQIATFLECKKTFFGKFKYYFKYSKKVKRNNTKNDIRDLKNRDNIEEEIEYDIRPQEIISENIKKNYTIEELIENYKELSKKETILKNTIMDINAIKLKNKNMAKKIENATLYIQEIDNHKRSIFEFWKYSNKDEVSVLPEGEEEEIGITKKIEKAFDYTQDLEQFGKTLDKLQRKILNKDEEDSIYIATNMIDILNKVKLGDVEPKDIENTLKQLKKEQKENGDYIEKDDLNIFGGIIEDSTKIKKIGNVSHREVQRDKFYILEITKMTRQIGFKLALEQVVKNIKNSLEKIKSPQDIILYKAIVDSKIDEKEFNIFNINPEKEIKHISKKEGDIINLYKIDLKKGQNILGFTNIIYYDNQNKTLPLGMDFSTNVMCDISKIDLNIKKSRTFNIVCLEDENDDFSKITVKKVIVYE